MGPPSYMRSVVDRNVVMRRITVYSLRVIIFGHVAVSDRSAEPQWNTTQCATRSNHYSTAAGFVTWKGDTKGIPVECRSVGDTHNFTAQAAAVTWTVSVGEFLTLL